MTDYQRRKKALIANFKYRCTPRGFLCRAYTLMKRRVEGKDRLEYAGLSILSREEFYSLFENDPVFLSLLICWRAALGTSLRQRKKALRLRPTPDRNEGIRGYEASNIRWLTYSENSAKR